MNDIKNTMDKIDNKLDKNSDSVTTNTAVIQSHDIRITGLENLVYGRPNSARSSNMSGKVKKLLDE